MEFCCFFLYPMYTRVGSVASCGLVLHLGSNIYITQLQCLFMKIKKNGILRFQTEDSMNNNLRSQLI